MSLSSYLASKYLTASNPSPSSSKKRKRKTAHSTSTGLTIADDDAMGWSTPNTNPDSDSDSTPQISNTGSSTFRKSKQNAWKTVGAPAPTQADLDADSIIASTAAENLAASHLDEAPAIEDDDDGSNVILMGDGTHAGLQSAAAVTAQMEKRRNEELRAWAEEEKRAGGKKRGKDAEETVYRDATGRRIDVSMKRAEARREADEKAEKERREKEEQAGEVQKREREERRERMEEARFMPLARGVEDEEMNRELRERRRWNDPAAAFLSEEKMEEGAGGVGASGGKGKGKGKTYQGAAAPNRYGIRPGWRWDGVDRGNGWEGERFRAMNRRTRNKELDFAWQEDT